MFFVLFHDVWQFQMQKYFYTKLEFRFIIALVKRQLVAYDYPYEEQKF